MSADEEDLQFCRTAAGLGWDPYALNQDMRCRILELAEKLGSLLDEAVPAIVADGPYEDWFSVVHTIANAKRDNSLALDRLRSLGDAVRPYIGTETHPWELGCDCARKLRELLGLDGAALPTTPEIAEALGEDAESIERVTTSRLDSDRMPAMVDGIITRDDHGTPAFAFRQLSDERRRFHFCRALSEVLLSPDTDTLLTRAHSERQQRNRAFAAEFLAPSSGLRSRVSRRVVDGDDIDELGTEFGVSSLVIEHQIRNHGIARVR